MNKNQLKQIILLLTAVIFLSGLLDIVVFCKFKNEINNQKKEQAQLDLELQKLAQDKELMLEQVNNDLIAIKQAENEIKRLKTQCGYSLTINE